MADGATLGGGSVGVLLLKDLSSRASAATAAEYLFSPGLIYFGTATIGPCPRQVIEETVRAWYELETNPTGMGYGHGATLVAAERVRERAANLLGCSSDEIVITRSTTDGMNAIAQGLRLTRGQRVLTTDQEHPGGRSCWEYLAHQQGVEIDRVRIPAGENDAGAIVDRFAAAITSDTRVISASHILSSTGLRMTIIFSQRESPARPLHGPYLSGKMRSGP
jgi:selenocysteine lyase/cysteine desulfurase